MVSSVFVFRFATADKVCPGFEVKHDGVQRGGETSPVRGAGEASRGRVMELALNSRAHEPFKHLVARTS